MNIKKIMRPSILNLTAYSSARSKFSEGILLDANENGFGSLFEELDLKLNRYPDPFQKNLRNLIGKYAGLPMRNIFCGVGSDEIIDLLIRIFCKPGRDSSIIAVPTYGMYKVCCDINDVKTNLVELDDDFQISPDSVIKKMNKNTKLVFLCSPNNPTGNLLCRDKILELCQRLSAIVIVDEAYIDYAGKGSVVKDIKKNSNLVVLRTFSKAWGLAGARCGYCAADSRLVDYLLKIKAPYNMNKLTEYAVSVSLRRRGERNKFIKLTIEERKRVESKLQNMPGIKRVFESDANFLLFKCNRASKVQKLLAVRGIIIRDRSNQPKLKDCLRVTIGTEVENNLFLTELESILCIKSMGTDINIVGQGRVKNLGEAVELIINNLRCAEIKRKTNETDIKVRVHLEGNGKNKINTGIGFFDHMLQQIAKHANINLLTLRRINICSHSGLSRI